MRSLNRHETSIIASVVLQVWTIPTRPERTIQSSTTSVSLQKCIRCNEATDSQSDDGLAVSCDVLVGLPSLRCTKTKKKGGWGGRMKRSKRAHTQNITDGLGTDAESI